MSGPKGWISLHRKLQNNWVWKADKKFTKGQAWVDILLLVNHEPDTVFFNSEVVQVDEGEHITSEIKLSERWGWSRTKVRNFLDLLEEDGMILNKKDKGKRTRLKVLNYGDYQKSENNGRTTKKQGNPSKRDNKKNNRKTGSNPYDDSDNAEVENNKKTGKKTGDEQCNPTKKNTNNNYNKLNNNKPSASGKSDNDSGDEFSISQKENGFYDYPEEFERIYNLYPSHRGTKKSHWRKWAATRRKGVPQEALEQAVKAYAAECKRNGTNEQYIKQLKTFVGPDEHWREYLNKNTESDQEDKEQKRLEEMRRKQIERVEKYG